MGLCTTGTRNGAADAASRCQPNRGTRRSGLDNMHNEEEDMTTYDTGTSTALSVPPTWLRILLGIVLILGGVFVLGDVALATLVSTLFIGYTAIIVGAFEILHAFWTKGWGGFIWQILLGALYIALRLAGGEPARVRRTDPHLRPRTRAPGVRHRADLCRLQALERSRLDNAPVRSIRSFGWPYHSDADGRQTGLWVLGLLLGVDLISHGVAWLTYGWLPRARTT